MLPDSKQIQQFFIFKAPQMGGSAGFKLTVVILLSGSQNRPFVFL